MRDINIILVLLMLLTPWSLKAVDRLYVSPTGNDSNVGSIVKPMRTIQSAIIKSGLFNKNDSVEIILRAGIYVCPKTIEVGKNIEDKSFISIKSYSGEKVIISGGKHFLWKDLSNITDLKVKERLRPEVRSIVKELNLKKAGIIVRGLHSTGFSRASVAAWNELFIDEKPMRIARWPNDSTVLIGKIVEPGGRNVKNGTRFPVFKYNETRPSSWSRATNFWISGYFKWGWADDMIQAGHVDTLDSTIHMVQQPIHSFTSGSPWQRWYVRNLLEEIDIPGEYVLDEQEGKMYVYPPSGKTNNIYVSIMDAPLLAIENVSNVTVDGIMFEYGCDMGIYLENTHNVIIKNCVIRNMGGIGVAMGVGAVSGGNQDVNSGMVVAHRKIGCLGNKIYSDILFNQNGGSHNGIVNCYIYDVGAGGISLCGGDRASLTPAGNYVENCRIHDYNRVEKSYRPGVLIQGVGNRVTKCDIFNAPSMAILFHGNNHLIEYCKIVNVCNEVDDQGAIYYGRDQSEQGNVIRYCYFGELNTQRSVSATYHDDGACGSEVYGNIYYKAGHWPVLIGGGSDHHYKNNVFIDSPVAIHIDNRMQNKENQNIVFQRLDEVNYKQPPYSTAYPHIVNYKEEMSISPMRNLIEGNLFYHIKNVLHGNSEWGEFCNNWITDQDPGFVDLDNPLKGFKANAKIFQYIKDFPRLPFKNIGCDLP